MKKLALLITAFALTTSAFAATTGTLELQGQVDQILAIEVLPETIASNLDLHTDANNLKVATVKELSNSATGYKINISSTNRGALKRANGNETFDYDLSYNNQNVNLNNPNGDTVNRKSTAGAYREEVDVKISYQATAQEDMVAGTYNDTVTFEIAAN